MLAGPKLSRRKRPPLRAHSRARGQTCTTGFKTCIQRRQLCAAFSSHGKPRCKRGHDYEVAQVPIDYTFGHDEIAQRVVTDDGQGGTTDVTHVFGHDGHGSVRVLYDLATTAATIAQAFTFSAYGEMIALHNATAQSIAVTNRLSSLGYSGEHFDAKAQQQYLRARFYNPANGQFNRLDPFAGNMQDPQSLHKYAYVHGDPIEHVDPSGQGIGVAVAVSIGLAIAALTVSGIHESVNSGLYRSSAVGRGGRDITYQLRDFANNFKQAWQNTNFVLREQAIDVLTSTFYSSGLWLPALGAWDISQLATYPTPTAFEHPNVGPPCPRTVTVGGDVYYVSDVNYFLWGFVHGLSYSDGTGGLSIESAAFYASVYRSAVGYPYFGAWRPHDGDAHGRSDWTRAGWRSARTGDFLTPAHTSSRSPALRNCIPSNVKYTGFLSGGVMAGLNPLSGTPELIQATGNPPPRV